MWVAGAVAGGRAAMGAALEDWLVRGARRRDSAFTLIDVLVTIAVVAVLMGILLPSMTSVRESTRRVVCGSNLRQITIGLAMYAGEQRGALPSSEYFFGSNSAGGEATGTRGGSVSLSQLDTLRIARTRGPRGDRAATWDGLGKLYATSVLPAPKLFYCPSQRGSRGFEQVSDTWLNPSAEIRGNFHFRPLGPQGQRTWWQLEGLRVTVLSDSLSSRDLLNHATGFNIAHGDTSVDWFADVDNRVGGSLPSAAATDGSIDGNSAILGAWEVFDSK